MKKKIDSKKDLAALKLTNNEAKKHTMHANFWYVPRH